MAISMHIHHSHSGIQQVHILLNINETNSTTSKACMGLFSQTETRKTTASCIWSWKQWKGSEFLWTFVSIYNSCYIHDVHAHINFFPFSISLINHSIVQKLHWNCTFGHKLIKPVRWSLSDYSPYKALCIIIQNLK